MSIFGSIKKAIFGERGPLGGQFSGKPAPSAPPATSAGQSPSQLAPAAGATPASPGTSVPQASAAPIDVEQVLAELAQRKSGSQLNWRTSIVDLMKLLEIDSGLTNRKELAKELGYTGATDGSAEMNIWLHKAVMRELERNGGVVPASMKD